MKRVGQAIFLFVATLVVLWAIFVRAPGPETVCEHIVTVTIEEAQAASMNPQSEAALMSGLQERCVTHKLDKMKLRGRVKYAEYAKCVTAATTLAQIETC
ncbi:MAG: hypothetical protein KUG77_16975 [Nannocystaceae bacterium]|nr:hypothetical protein [Nannocystaceae bacterium]